MRNAQSKKTILITGGAGFIGSHLTQRLFNEGHRVIIYDNLATGSLHNIKTIDGTFIQGDILDSETLAKALKGVEIVFHLAAKVTVAESIIAATSYHTVNVEGTKNVIDLSRKNGISRVIFASSAAVYGNSPHSAVCEVTDPHPLSALGKTKYEAEKLCLAVNNKGMSNLVLRFFNVYGPHQNTAYESVISTFITRIKKKQPIYFYGNGTAIRDFIYIHDVVDACVAAIAYQGKETTFNVGTGKGHRISTVAKLIGRITSDLVHIDKKPRRDGEIDYSVACICRITAEMHFTPDYSLAKGLKQTYTSY